MFKDKKSVLPTVLAIEATGTTIGVVLGAMHGAFSVWNEPTSWNGYTPTYALAKQMTKGAENGFAVGATIAVSLGISIFYSQIAPKPQKFSAQSACQGGRKSQSDRVVLGGLTECISAT